MRNGSVRALMVGLLLAGCSDPPVQPDPQPFVVENDDVWSGSSITVRSAGFVGADPAVLLDADTLAFTRVNDSTLSVALPDLPGTHQLHIASPSVLSTPVPVHLNGFLGAREGPVFMGRAVRGAELTEVYGSGPTGLRRWNVSTGATLDYPDSMHTETCSRGVGAGPHIGELVLLHGDCSTPRWWLWRIEPTVALLDTTQLGSPRFVDVLGPGRYVLPGSHMTVIIVCDTTCVQSDTRGESGFDVVHSPTGHRAVPLAYVVSDTGAPVIDGTTGRLGYYVPQLESVLGAAFSESGDTLYLTGEDNVFTPGVNLLLAARAGDGSPLMVDTLSFNSCGVAVDPVRPLLYVAGNLGAGTNGRSVLGVFDRASLEPIALLHADSAVYYTPCQVLPSPLERRVYVSPSIEGTFDIRVHSWVASYETPS